MTDDPPRTIIGGLIMVDWRAIDFLSCCEVCSKWDYCLEFDTVHGGKETLQCIGTLIAGLVGKISWI